MKREGFPFAAMAGMEKAKRALLMALTNPRAGGLLVSGGRGTGKSTFLRSARELQDGPWKEIPVSVTEDRLFGAVDTEAAIRCGKKELLPGLLDEADGGILYVDDAGILRRDLLLTVLDIEEKGRYRLEREGLSRERSLSFTVLAAMDPAAGTLPSSILDRFGLFISIEEEKDPGKRAVITERVLQWEKDGAAFRKEWEEETDRLRHKVKNARALLPSVSVSPAMMQLAASYGSKALLPGHRGDLYLVEAARAIAALSERTYVLPKDVEEAAEYVLPHRMRKAPEEETPKEEPQEGQKKEEPPQSDNQEEQTQQTDPPREDPSQPPREEDSQEKSHHKADREKEEGRENEDETRPAPQEKTDAIDGGVTLPPMAVMEEKDRILRRGSGKRSRTRTDLLTGRYVRAEFPKGKPRDIALDATLRAAAPHQKERKPNGCAVVIRMEDVRTKVRETRTGNVFLFLVDASGSMGARERMRTVKGVILRMLCDAYQKRDRVGMAAFRRKKAEVILPVTRSVDLAEKKLSSLPTGGKTPLASGLETAASMVDGLLRQDKTQKPVVIVITDGRATAASAKGADPAEEALEAAKKLGRRRVPMAVIDTEQAFVKLGIARDIARLMGASYYQMNRLNEKMILSIAKHAGEAGD